MKRLISLIVVLLVLAGFCVWWFSPTQVVKRRSRDLLQILTLDAGAAPASRTISSLQLDRLLKPNVEFDFPSLPEANGTHDRIEISSAFSWLCSNAKETRMKLGVIESVTLNGDDGWCLEKLSWSESTPP